MDPIDTTRTGQTQAPAPRPTEQASGASGITSDFETFLQMLSVQLQNQDPLNPVDSADYAVQLATFSSVEQQVQTNDLLKDIASRFTLSGISQFANWVGMEARSAAPVELAGQPITVSPKPADIADRAQLIAMREDGTVAARIDIPLDGEDFVWIGDDGQGNLLDAGTYALSVQSLLGGEIIEEVPAESYARVAEVRTDGGTATLVMESGAAVPAGEVTAVRRP